MDLEVEGNFDIKAWSELQRQEYPDMRLFFRFEDISDFLVNDGGLAAWILSGKGKLSEIPEQYRTPRLMHVACRGDESAFLLVTPDRVPNYRQVALDSVSIYPDNMVHVDKNYVDEQFVIDASLANVQVLGSIKTEIFRSLVTEHAESAICSASLPHAAGFAYMCGVDSLKDKYIAEAIKVNFTDYTLLRYLKKNDLLVGMLRDGFWPASSCFRSPSFQAAIVPPANPLEALERLEAVDTGYKILHRSWLKAQPQNEVVEALHCSQKGLDVLFEIYSERELQLHAKSYRGIAGRLISNDLGV